MDTIQLFQYSCSHSKSLPCQGYFSQIWYWQLGTFRQLCLLPELRADKLFCCQEFSPNLYMLSESVCFLLFFGGEGVCVCVCETFIGSVWQLLTPNFLFQLLVLMTMVVVLVGCGKGLQEEEWPETIYFLLAKTSSVLWQWPAAWVSGAYVMKNGFLFYFAHLIPIFPSCAL